MRRSIRILAGILLIASLLAACGPNPGPQETVGNPFTQGTSGAAEESTGAGASSGSHSGGATFPPDFDPPSSKGAGFIFHYDRFPDVDGYDLPPDSTQYIYQGGEIQIPFQLRPDGYEYAGIGLIAFLDGIPQPFRLNEEDDYQYMNILYLPDGVYEFTASLLPVTGTVGQYSELWIKLVYSPDFENHDKNYINYENRDTMLGSWASVLFLTEPEKPAALPVEDHGISQTVSYEKLTYEEALAQEEAQARLDHVTNYSVNGGENAWGIMTRVYGTTAETPVTIRLTLCGPSDISYRLVFYYDDLPITIQPTEVIDLQDGEKAVIEATVDLTGFDGYARLTAFLVPLNSEMNPDGTLTANQVLCDCPIDLVLTSAKDMDEFFSGNS